MAKETTKILYVAGSHKGIGKTRLIQSMRKLRPDIEYIEVCAFKEIPGTPCVFLTRDSMHNRQGVYNMVVYFQPELPPEMWEERARSMLKILVQVEAWRDCGP